MLHAIEGIVLLLVPAVFLVPSMRALARASWGGSVEACVVLSRDGAPSCAPAWVLLGLGGAILIGWLVALVAVVRMTVAQSRDVEIPIRLDARFLHVSTPSSLWSGPAPLSVRWEEAVAIAFADAKVDAPVLRHLMSDQARWSLATEDGAARTLRLAGV